MANLRRWALGSMLAVVAAGTTAVPVSARVFSGLFPPAPRIEPAASHLSKGPLSYLPPAGYLAENWTHPNGCTYARNGRRDREVWMLTRGVAYMHCTAIIAQAGTLDAY